MEQVALSGGQSGSECAEYSKCGFQIEAIEEAMPSADMMGMPGMCHEMRRPMMLLVKVKKV